MAYTTINKSTDYFNIKLYAGDGTSSRDITGVGFQPDFTWIKQRSNTFSHVLGNAVSGDNKFLSTNGTGAESTDNTKFRTFVSDGFQIGSHNSVNNGSNTYASWNWKANGTGSANTDGSINSTVSVNTTAGFSIVSWTGNSGTVGHGLGAKPAMIIVKSRQSTNNWVVMHKGLTGGMDTNVIVLNGTGAEGGGGAGMAEPTSSVFTITGGLAANDNNIAYCFAEKTGYSKFGSYVGNGNANGPMIYTGFKPAFVIMKNASQAGKWLIMDNKRPTSGANPNNARLFADVSNVESTSSNMIDMLSNGFKIRTSDTDHNASGDINIYMAFAEAPLVGSNDVTAKAK